MSSSSRAALARRHLEKDPRFMVEFVAAKARVDAMDFRWVEVETPAVSAVFEVYAALELGTEGAFNRFETH